MTTTFDPAELETLGRERTEARRRAVELTAQMRPLVLAAATAGHTPDQIVAWSGLSSAAVRTIEREGGLPPRRTGGGAAKPTHATLVTDASRA
jgi:hypothetical protein